MRGFHIILILTWGLLSGCGKGLSNYFGEHDPKRARVDVRNNQAAYLSASGISEGVLVWTATNDGSYSVRLNGSCESGVLLADSQSSGEVRKGEEKTLSIKATDLLPGENTLTFCVFVNSTGKIVPTTIILVRDDTPPVSSASPGGGTFTTSTSVVLSCSDHCDRIIYTLDGTAPAMDSQGVVTQGRVYDGPISLPDPGASTLQFFAVDRSGNREAPKSESFIVDTRLPSPTITLVSHDRLSTNGYASATIQWTATAAGLDYQVLRDAANCSAGGVSLISGVTALNNSLTITASQLVDNTSHNVLICVTNTAGLVGYASLNLHRKDALPTSDNILAETGYSTVPTVTLGCIGCDKLIYTTDGSTPAFNADGSIAAGTLYATGGFTIPDGAVTTVKFRSWDNYGNLESAVQSAIYPVDSNIPTVGFVSQTRTAVSMNGYTTSTVRWTTSRADRPFEMRRGGTNCTDPSGTVVASGTTASGNIDTAVPVGSLISGDNTLRICVYNLINAPGSSATFVIQRDDTGPVISYSPTQQGYNSPQDVTISCTDNCVKIVYSTNPLIVPEVDAAGNIVRGTEYTAPLTLPDQTVTTIQVAAVDAAGNLACTCNSATYQIDSNIPVINIVSNEHVFVSAATGVGANEVSNLEWNSSRSGLNYQVRLGGTSCSTGTVSGGANASGVTPATGNVISTIRAQDFTADGAHTVRICVANLIGNYGFSTQGFTRDSVAPTYTASIADGSENIPVTTSQIVFTFDEPFSSIPAASQPGPVTLQDCRQSPCASNSSTLSGFSVATNWDSAIHRYTVTFLNAQQSLPEYTSIRFDVGGGGARDRAGNPLASFNVRFRTGLRNLGTNIVGTGQTQCFYQDGSNWVTDSLCNAVAYAQGSTTAPTGQNGQYQYPDVNEPRSYTPAVHGVYTNDRIVTDNVTGMIWKQCIEGRTGISCGSGSANQLDWYGAINACSILNNANSGNGYFGRKDWRLPTLLEMSTIIDFGQAAGARINTSHFPATSAVSYWTYTTSPLQTTDAILVSFQRAEFFTTLEAKNGGNRNFRCVAGNSGNWRSHTFSDNGDGTIFDNGTLLMWEKCPQGKSGGTCTVGTPFYSTWTDALAACEASTTGGYTDWRLPTAVEITSLDTSGSSFPGSGLDGLNFPGHFFGTGSAYYWTSTTLFPYDGDLTMSQAYSYRSDKKDLVGRTLKSASNYARCVRGP